MKPLMFQQSGSISIIIGEELDNLIFYFKRSSIILNNDKHSNK